MSNSIRTPKQGKTATSRRIAEAVDNEAWQTFRLSLKGTSTTNKLRSLKWYYEEMYLIPRKSALHSDPCTKCENVEIRVDNYIKALCRGGQLYAGESLETALLARPIFTGLRIRRD